MPQVGIMLSAAGHTRHRSQLRTAEKNVGRNAAGKTPVSGRTPNPRVSRVVGNGPALFSAGRSPTGNSETVPAELC